MSADATITVRCDACAMEVSVPNDLVGEYYAIDFEARHAAHAAARTIRHEEET